MLLIMLMLIERHGEVNQKDFAARLHNWMLHGFKEFGDLGVYIDLLCKHESLQFNVCTHCDAGGMGIGMTVSGTLRHPKFLEEPATAAQQIWEQSG